MLKRCFIFILLAICCLVILPVSAYADILIEPKNDFYSKHSSECSRLDKSFYANGKIGYVSIKEEPGSKRNAAIIENGEIVFIMATYDYNGEIWGVTQIYADSKKYDELINGWIPMDDLLHVYDYSSFAEEHQSAFYAYEDSYDSLDTGADIVIWSWPGSGTTQGTLEALSGEDLADFSISHAYKDEVGREWGFIGYWHGYRNMWICISDPGNYDIPAFNPPPQPELWPPSEVPAVQNGLSTPLLIIILVIVLVIGTAVMIRIFWKPKNDK